MLPWDHWGTARDMRPSAAPTEATTRRIDALAALIGVPHPDWRALRDTYEREEGFWVPGTVVNFPKGVPNPK